MVVAVLAVLFVAGAALLTVVTFSSRSIDAATAEREARYAVDAIERLVGMKLRDGFLNADGVPYALESPLVMHQPGRPNVPCCDPNVDSMCPTEDCVLATPTYGEQPGVHPWIDVTEPIEINDSEGQRCEFRLVSNLMAALDNNPLRQPGSSNDDRSLRVRVDSPQAAGFSSGFALNANGLPEYYNDADGDGVLDAVEMTIPPGMLPANVHRVLADRLRATNYPGDPDRLTVTLRIVPHGSMANVNDSHTYISRVAMGYPAQDIGWGGGPSNAVLFGAEYRPASNEWLLRNRGLLLPLNVQQTRLVENMAQTLFEPQFGGQPAPLYSPSLDPTVLGEPSSGRHWWRYDPVADTADTAAAWRTLMNPANSSSRTYDVSHNLTTEGHDDLLMRSFVYGGADILNTVAADARNPSTGKIERYQSYPGKYALDQYPDSLETSDDIRRGRLKVSLPHLDTMRFDKDGNFIPGAKDRVVQLLRDAFHVMLSQREGYFAGGTDPKAERRAIAVQAAMLAANVVDYADADPSPTAVMVMTNGLPVVGTSPDSRELWAYGFERQPFITEIATATTRVDGCGGASDVAEEASATFAIELYNPYDTPIDLSQFELTDLESGTIDVRNQVSCEQLERLSDEPLSGTIPGAVGLALDDPSRFVTICGYGAVCPDGDGTGAGTGTILSTPFGLDEDSVITLVRPVTTSGGTIRKVIVDLMKATGDYVFDDPAAVTQPPLQLGQVGAIGETIRVTIQRDTSVVPTDPLQSYWRFTVPRQVKVWDYTDVSELRLGLTNSDATYDKPVQDDIYPVHADVFVANADTMIGQDASAESAKYFSWAYPTTGSMLLAMRMAHAYEVVDAGGGTEESGALTSPFNRVHSDLLGMTPDGRERNIVEQYDQIDNGRFPVFDASPTVVSSASSGVAVARERLVDPTTPPLNGRVEGLEALPWGQLVFDYFTAIPFDFGAPDWTNPYSIMQDKYKRDYPRVDQGRLRVHGRVNINTAPPKVLEGLQMLEPPLFSRSYQTELVGAVGPGANTLGPELAKAVLAYREARNQWTFQPPDVGAYEGERSPYGVLTANADFYRPRRGYGFLTVGELLNVRHPSTLAANTRFDSGAVDDPAEVALTDPRARYEFAIAKLVALDDNWVTTKSHVFTIYGVIRGAHYPLTDPTEGPDPNNVDGKTKLASFREADQKAIRFQSTVDRLPMLFGERHPVRIGSRMMGGLVDERAE